MDVRIEPVPLKGNITVPASKSELHRMLICAAFSDGPVRILAAPGYLSRDIEATAGCLEALGADITPESDALTVIPSDRAKVSAVMNCIESGSTLRMLLPVAASVCGSLEVSGEGSLHRRPLSGLIKTMEEHGVVFTSDALPFRTSGILRGGRFTVEGNITSQYLSGLLLAAPLLEEGAEVLLSSELVSAGYTQLTADVMRQFGRTVISDGRSFRCQPGGYISPGAVTAGGDWSSAAAFIAMAAAGRDCDITVSGLQKGSCQPDRGILDILGKAGAEIGAAGDGIRVKSSELTAFEADAAVVPDLIPVLSALACVAEGRSVFRGCGRLRYKESDRLAAMTGMLSGMGADIREDGDLFTVERTGNGMSLEVDPGEDHRTVMAAAVAAYAFSVPVTVKNAEAVTKSYPDFFKDLRNLGGRADVL